LFRPLPPHWIDIKRDAGSIVDALTIFRNTSDLSVLLLATPQEAVALPHYKYQNITASSQVVFSPQPPYPPFTMRCLSFFSTETKYHHPSSDKPHTTAFSARIQRIFKGPPERQPQPQYRNEKEKKYHHKPTHSASSFIKTTTTPAMIEADPTLLFEGPLSEQSPSPTADHSMPRESLI
jgi:hypothetical protein